jgi:hypothetical protein
MRTFVSINISDAARRMNKSQSWLSHRVNRCEVNGKRARFTVAEWNAFRDAVLEMMRETAESLEAIAVEEGFSKQVS